MPLPYTKSLGALRKAKQVKAEYFFKGKAEARTVRCLLVAEAANWVKTKHHDLVGGFGLLAALISFKFWFNQSSKQGGNSFGYFCGMCYWFVVKCYLCVFSMNGRKTVVGNGFGWTTIA